uniref:Uncharacterized protein n=1 Tax=Cacopsylla melanoneura TaxID=428564 RepID=A0A8D8RIF8_9HEMI
MYYVYVLTSAYTHTRGSLHSSPSSCETEFENFRQVESKQNPHLPLYLPKQTKPLTTLPTKYTNVAITLFCLHLCGITGGKIELCGVTNGNFIYTVLCEKLLPLWCD